jgi:hypothetical protein
VTPERRFFGFVAQYPRHFDSQLETRHPGSHGTSAVFLELALAIGVLTCQVKGLDFQQGRCG